MFSKAKRFEAPDCKNKHRDAKNQEIGKVSQPIKKAPLDLKSKHPPTSIQKNQELSQCSSRSVRSIVTPKFVTAKVSNNLNKCLHSKTKPVCKKAQPKFNDDVFKAQEVEIRNKDYTIDEYLKLIEELKTEITALKNQQQEVWNHENFNNINNHLSRLTLKEYISQNTNEIISQELKVGNNSMLTNDLNLIIHELEKKCEKLEQEVSTKQVELTDFEEMIVIRDSLCKDLQEKLTNVQNCLEETCQSLEMVKRHHELALEANESIRREYKAELDTLKIKFEEEKITITNNAKTEQENMYMKYNSLMESIKIELNKEKDDLKYELQQKLAIKDLEMKAKLEQVEEATTEKLKLCEIQFEERSHGIQKHCLQQEEQVKNLESIIRDLKHDKQAYEEKIKTIRQELKALKIENESFKTEKFNLSEELGRLKIESDTKISDIHNELKNMTENLDKAIKEKNKFEMSLSITRDIVQILTVRLQESDSEVEILENKMQILTNTKKELEDEINTYKNSLKNTILECDEYKEALVNILKSKAALAKEHSRIMEHNVTLIESLKNVEQEAYRELGSIKNELIEDVEIIKKESNSQILTLREEVEKKEMLCELAKEHAGVATAAAEQSRVLLAQASAEIARLENENRRFCQQIQDQQSLVVELSLLRQENEELTMTVAKQSSIIDKMKKDLENQQHIPKSPSALRKVHKIGKENSLTLVSPLRERNH